MFEERERERGKYYEGNFKSLSLFKKRERQRKRENLAVIPFPCEINERGSPLVIIISMDGWNGGKLKVDIISKTDISCTMYTHTHIMYMYVWIPGKIVFHTHTPCISSLSLSLPVCFFKYPEKRGGPVTLQLFEGLLSLSFVLYSSFLQPETEGERTERETKRERERDKSEA